MKENQVATILVSLPSYYDEIDGNSPVSKLDNVLSLKVRNTIPWSLECELENDADRELGYKMYTISFDQDK